ncbi:WNK2 family protein [Megaselia abdita]
MCNSNIINEADSRAVAKLLKVQVTALLKERKLRQSQIQLQNIQAQQLLQQQQLIYQQQLQNQQNVSNQQQQQQPVQYYIHHPQQQLLQVPGQQQIIQQQMIHQTQQLIQQTQPVMQQHVQGQSQPQIIQHVQGQSQPQIMQHIMQQQQPNSQVMPQNSQPTMQQQIQQPQNQQQIMQTPPQIIQQHQVIQQNQTQVIQQTQPQVIQHVQGQSQPQVIQHHVQNQSQPQVMQQMIQGQNQPTVMQAQHVQGQNQSQNIQHIQNQNQPQNMQQGQIQTQNIQHVQGQTHVMQQTQPQMIHQHVQGQSQPQQVLQHVQSQQQQQMMQNQQVVQQQIPVQNQNLNYQQPSHVQRQPQAYQQQQVPSQPTYQQVVTGQAQVYQTLQGQQPTYQQQVVQQQTYQNQVVQNQQQNYQQQSFQQPQPQIQVQPTFHQQGQLLQQQSAASAAVQVQQQQQGQLLQQQSAAVQVQQQGQLLQQQSAVVQQQQQQQQQIIQQQVFKQQQIQTQQQNAQQPINEQPQQHQPQPPDKPIAHKQSKQKTRRSKGDGIPKLMVTNVENETVVDCHMENKQKTITFKFDISDVVPSEVANKLIAQDLLSEAQGTVFTDMIKDIVRQVKLNPNQIPIPSVSSIRRNMKKVRHGSLTRPRTGLRTHQRNRSRDETSSGIDAIFNPEDDSMGEKLTVNLRKARSDDILKIQFLDDQFIRTAAEKLRTRESSDPVIKSQKATTTTQGTDSRKTSTSVSEYASFSSECTPENTITSVSTLEPHDAYVDKSNVDTDPDTSETVLPKKMERKVSRFLVSPVAPIDKKDSSPTSPDVIDHVPVLQEPQTASTSTDNQSTGSSTKIGPEHINTLELLKIGLENITHAHVPPKTSQSSLGQQKLSQPTQQVDLACQGDNSVASMSSISQSTSITATSSTKGSSVYNSRRTSLDNSSSDVFNINTPTNIIETTAAQTPSECSSDYSSSGSGRKLSKQGSLDQTKDSMLEGSLASLQQKLAQLTAAPLAVPAISQTISCEEHITSDSSAPISTNDSEGSLVSLHQKLVQITSSASSLPAPTASLYPSSSNEQVANFGVNESTSEQIGSGETQRVSAPAMLQLQNQNQIAPSKKMSRFSVSLVQESSSTVTSPQGMPENSHTLFVSNPESGFSTPTQDYEFAPTTLLTQTMPTLSQAHSLTPTQPKMQTIPISYIMTPSTTTSVTTHIPQHSLGDPHQQQQQQQQQQQHSAMGTTIRGTGDELLSLAATNADLVSSVDSDIKLNFDNTRKKFCNLLLETNVRSRLVLLLQRQRIEEDELRLKHIAELETFENNIKPQQIPQTSQAQQWHQPTNQYINTMQQIAAAPTTYQSSLIQQNQGNSALFVTIPHPIPQHPQQPIQMQAHTIDDSTIQMQQQVQMHHQQNHQQQMQAPQQQQQPTQSSLQPQPL